MFPIRNRTKYSSGSLPEKGCRSQLTGCLSTVHFEHLVMALAASLD